LSFIYYNYTPELRKVRCEETKAMYWQHLSNEKIWEKGVNNMPVPLYSQEAVEIAKSEETIYIVEGEKDVDTMTRLGLTATTLPNGANSEWKYEYTAFFENKRVVILQDNDEAGNEYAVNVAMSLLLTASSIKILDLTKEWTQLGKKGDITDVAELQGNDDEVLCKLKALEKVTAEYTPFETAPIPLDKVNIPEFPVECLPAIISGYVKALAVSTQTPVEMGGILSLGILATAMQSKFIVQITNDHKEQLSLYTVAIANPGERKSPVIRKLLEPFYIYENTVNAELLQKIVRNNFQKKFLEANLEKLKKKCLKEGLDESVEIELQEATTKLAEFKELFPLRLTVDDVTPEKLIDMLEQQGGNITIASAEGGIFNLLSKENDRGTNLIEPLLKGNSGDRLILDRMSRKGNIIENPHISTVLTVQPQIITEIIGNKKFVGRGMLARFLFLQTRSRIGGRLCYAPEIKEETKTAYHSLITKLLDCKTTATFLLNDEAKEEYQKFHDIVEKRLLEEWHFIEAFGNKFEGCMLRIAGLLHGAEYTDDNYIGADTIKRAIRIAECLGKHTEAVFLNGGANEDVENAKYIIERLKTLKSNVISKGDMQRNCQRFKTAEDMLPSMKLLEENNYIKTIKPESGKKGRPSENIFINPNIF